MLLAAAVVVLAVAGGARARVFERCELARELLRLGVGLEDIPTWVCIAEKESSFNTSAVGNVNGDGSGDHGLFQISDKYWCSPQGWACNIPCSLLEDDDIADDLRCAKRIFRQHKFLSGNGYNAWAVYKPYCAGDTSSYVEGCFESNSIPEENTSTKNDVVVESYSAREGNNAEKIQVLDLEMMEKNVPQKSREPQRLWQPWTWF